MKESGGGGELRAEEKKKKTLTRVNVINPSLNHPIRES